MRTFIVQVRGSVKMFRRALLLIEVPDHVDPIEAALKRAHANADVEWVPDGQPVAEYTATEVETQNALDLVSLLAEKRTRDLTDDEEHWLNDVRVRSEIDAREIGRFNAGRPKRVVGHGSN